MKKSLFLLLFLMTCFSPMFANDLPSADRPLVLILLGPPGAGKGTHEVPLSERLDIPHISTGDLFRDNIRYKTPLGKKAESYITQGKLVPDDLVLDMVFSRIAQSDCKNGYILDGFPRSLHQAKALDKKLKGRVHIVAVNFNVSDQHLIERIVGRSMCRDCKIPYHDKYSPPKKKNTCDKCGGDLYHRKDDNETTMKSRLKIYHDQSSPLIDYYDLKNTLYDINSQKSQREVFEELMQTIEAVLERVVNFMI